MISQHRQRIGDAVPLSAMLMEYEMFPLTASIPGTGSAPLPVSTDIGGVKSFKTVLRRVTVTVSGSLDHRL
jgi:hypothetical protein